MYVILGSKGIWIRIWTMFFMSFHSSYIDWNMRKCFWKPSWRDICKFNFKKMVHQLLKYAKFDVTCLNKLEVQYHSSTNKLFSHKPLCCRHNFLLPSFTMGQKQVFFLTIVHAPSYVIRSRFETAPDYKPRILGPTFLVHVLK